MGKQKAKALEGLQACTFSNDDSLLQRTPSCQLMHDLMQRKSIFDYVLQRSFTAGSPNASCEVIGRLDCETACRKASEGSGLEIDSASRQSAQLDLPERAQEPSSLSDQALPENGVDYCSWLNFLGLH